uniref:UBX domain-containing protein 10 n=1 Tax=Scatophagus argus TaxID=75038 RepID=UPI001ED8201D|nr:UBX domain-containing protein 10 [Scatophagus argus]
MHLIRPKKSKCPNNSQGTGETDSIHRTPATPGSPGRHGPDGNLRSQSQPIMCPSSQLNYDDALEMLQQVPAAHPKSLNKYNVLPSIKRRRSEASPVENLDQLMAKMSLSDLILQQSHGPKDPNLPAGTQTSSSEANQKDDVHFRVSSQATPPGPAMDKKSGATGSLLLAIKAPHGRFQQHFSPTDTLLMVKVSAEVRYGANFEDVCIETMDVPRRTFRDMNLTLAQCGILNRSLLCISPNDSVVEHE